MTKIILTSALIATVSFAYMVFSSEDASVSYGAPDYEQEYYNDLANKMNGKSRCDFMQANGVDC